MALPIEKKEETAFRDLETVTRSKLTQKSFKSNILDYVIEKIFLIFGLIAVFVLFLILFFLIREGSGALREVGIMEYLTTTRWYPSSPQGAGYGALPFIMSSIMVTVGALIIAIPWGIFTAIYIAEIAPRRVREILKPAVEILAIFPSVILGFIALVILSPIVANIFGLSNGLTALTASLILSVMALPTIISIAEDSIKSVPKDYREAAYALGASRWETIKTVSVPAAKSGIMAGVMLGFGRAVGETMTVLMAAGNAIDMPLREFFGIVVPDFLTSVRTLTANIAIEGSDVAWGSLHYSSLFVLALILFVITFIVNMIADYLINKQRRKLGDET
ncbi:phosphate ABC transporter permease subunit PstC [Salisediminibacterium selenitireducens]|uniref:Phosphate transport system permease protein n=1 Tax=Bacillus selenitireducens (strain ATCC 700615 / DSM 15326 / MLS10) TaxID=439292 RepID=D6XT43_BACIE|nr:phosphate ABC transporter permease subunit PstC [Salisediminibacterium selenitireducens]ADH98979.1 phosphate ABC transporter, inner membrane subunit PstC [[Bacillus] selenitireducens MLS10]